MFETRNSFTPAGARYAIYCKERKIDELTKKRIEFMHKDKTSHPAYEKLTDTEFHNRKCEFARWTLSEQRRIREEIKALEKYL